MQSARKCSRVLVSLQCNFYILSAFLLLLYIFYPSAENHPLPVASRPCFLEVQATKNAMMRLLTEKGLRELDERDNWQNFSLHYHVSVSQKQVATELMLRR